MIRPVSPPSLLGLAVALARHWWPQVVALAATSAVVAATIVGAAGTGSAVERGLLRLAWARLGGIEAVVSADQGVSPRLLASLAGVDTGGPLAHVPAFVASVAVETAGRDRPPVRATLVACDDVAALGFAPAPPPLASAEAWVNAPLAALLDVAEGDAIVVRVPHESPVPVDAPLGRRTEHAAGRRLGVAAVLPPAGLGQLALRPTQVTEPLVICPLAAVRPLVDRDHVANRVFVAAAEPHGPSADAAAAITRSRAVAAVCARELEVDLADVGLVFAEEVPAPAAGSPTAAARVARLTSRRLLLPPEADRGADTVLGPHGGRPSLVFLANAITVADTAGMPTAARVPYSTIAGIDAIPHPLGDLVDDAGMRLPLPDADEVVIDRWMADDLAAQGRPVAVGDTLLVTMFAPETVAGRIVETTHPLRVSGIAALSGAAVARGFVPPVAGVTDERSIADWDPPFPFDRSRVRTTPPHDEDDRYWRRYGPAPKAFVRLDTARRLAGSRFGMTTAWHVPLDDAAASIGLEARLGATLEPARLGVTVEAVRADAVVVARGSTPFAGLFLGLSSFLVGAGLLLLWLLFGLLVAARGRDIGVLAAVGWPPVRLAGLLVLVGGAAAVGGVMSGVVVGPLWTRLLLAMLAHSWDASVAVGGAAPLTLAPPAAAAVWPAAAAALMIALSAIACSAWRASCRPPRSLLAGGEITRSAARRSRGTVCSLGHLAARGLDHAPRRAFAVAAIVGVAEFLLVAVSSFTLQPPEDPTARRSPTGGWTWLARFGSPTAVDPSDPETRMGLGLSPAAAAALAECRITRLRSSGGDEASCANLYASDRPTVLGVGPDFVARGGFSFVAHAAQPGSPAAANPWLLLESGRTAMQDVPVILDEATARWALQLGGVGSRFEVADESGTPVTAEIVGLLAGSMLQGFVVAGEQDFVTLFPQRSGYGLALVDASQVAESRRSAVPGALAAAWADAAVSVESTAARLASLQAVQNTFLAGFQLLGGLGLLLGTAGVAAVQAQGVVERLGALSLLRAIGFRIGRLRRLLVLETVMMVGRGLAWGAAAGWLAALPFATASLPLGWIASTCGLTLGVACLASLATATRQVIPERPQAAE